MNGVDGYVHQNEDDWLLVSTGTGEEVGEERLALCPQVRLGWLPLVALE